MHTARHSATRPKQPRMDTDFSNAECGVRNAERRRERKDGVRAAVGKTEMLKSAKGLRDYGTTGLRTTGLRDYETTDHVVQ